MKLVHMLCLMAIISLSGCAGSVKGGLMGEDKAWCGYYGQRCEEENNTQCSIWGRCGEEEPEAKAEENDPQCSIWGRCD